MTAELEADPPKQYLQQNQPEGVPPLALTGERTLPDVPEENYWFQRHLVVYQWIRDRVAGLKVIDMASGEGYGADTLAGTAREVVGVEANPDAFAHAVARYPRVRFERSLVETYHEPADAVSFLQTIEHVQDPGAVLENFKRSAPLAFVSTPNVLTLAPEGEERSGNPWHIKEYRLHEFRELCEAHYDEVEVLGLYHARKLLVHERAIRLGWDRVHPALRITKRFYDWFVPAMDVRDFVLRPADDRALDFLAVCRSR
jgi:2-polyprenyl-3-methyl-5-hydroxy-6-metoxy-1,4-benzoquinol methylase